ncbi:polysaccharide deacetylase family protein [Sphingosinicella sp. CPCC 101087]|uniref:polysaccharide deacetylase family protein n=1 Tax=Sphingosinicella sp. CPCC 101087 TaxID=2497754 RepID=UPI00101DBA94|nr:polysaccharide deacetylase family protein [Sphingosinicella sp. CPCC 101087]
MIPELLVVVDTEEDFDWSAPFSRSAVATRSIPAQARAHEIYDRLGVVPTYVVDYPVASDPVASGYLRTLLDAGKAEIGAHLHPWVTPPHAEEVNPRNSYHGNLPPELERAKIETITDAIRGAFGEAPTIFKAGRHGFGPHTAAFLAELGYKVDCSRLPYVDLRHDGGPDHRRAPAYPYWLDRPGGLLEVPPTVGFFGAAAGLAPRFGGLFDSRAAERLHLPGLLARAGLAARSRLTPEGVSADEQCRLIAAMARRGHRTFSLVYHSPSLQPGHTPYVRTEADLAAFLTTLEKVLLFFRDRMGGRFTTISQVYRDYSAARQRGAADRLAA